MIARLAEAVLALTALCLGESRREWALAMEAEFEAARADGKPLTFAFGCMAAALRELPRHEEGRFAIASHVLALLLIVPTAALLISSMLADFPNAYLAGITPQHVLEAAGERIQILSEANRGAVPALAGLLTLLAAAHLRLAWLLLERDWAGAAEAASLVAAATVTLVLFTAVVFGHCPSAPAQGAALAIELVGILALARWHGRSSARFAEALT